MLECENRRAKNQDFKLNLKKNGVSASGFCKTRNRKFNRWKPRY